MEETNFKELQSLMSMRFTNLLEKNDAERVDNRINELCSEFTYEEEVNNERPIQ